MSEVTDMTEHNKYTPMLEEITAAFKAVFPDEQIRDVEYVPALPDRKQEIFAIRSDKKTRRYLRTDADQPFEAVLRATPELPPDKNE